MKFQKGMKRPESAGRKKGVANKKKLKLVADILAENGLDPASEIIGLIQGGDIKDRDRLDAWFNLLSYCQAKPKENEPEKESDPSEDLTGTPTQALLQLVKDNNGAS